jgi:hypothetical protein
MNTLIKILTNAAYKLAHKVLTLTGASQDNITRFESAVYERQASDKAFEDTVSQEGRPKLWFIIVVFSFLALGIYYIYKKIKYLKK